MIDDARPLAYNEASETDRLARSCPVRSLSPVCNKPQTVLNLQMVAGFDFKSNRTEAKIG